MATQPVDDIGAVLGRFQDWAGTQAATAAKPGIREIPYEEALASDRYRWKAATHARNQLAEKPESTADSKAGGSGREPAEPSRNRRAAKKVGARDRDPIAPERAVPKTVSSAVRRTAAKSGGQRQFSAKGGESKTKPAFRQVLSEALKPSELVVAQPDELVRHNAVSVRLAPAERAQIQKRAAEAGTTVSAYIRQCALEVEQMRNQVRQALAAIEQGRPVPPLGADKIPTPQPGFFARIARRFLAHRNPALALGD
jgi:hypothetical protein